MSCSNNVRQVGLAFMNYYAAYNRFPSPAYDAHSWRVRVLPFMQSSPVYSEYRFDEPWDSEANLSLDVRPLVAKGGDMQISPDKNVNFRRHCFLRRDPGSPYTLESVGNGFVIHRQLTSGSL